MRLDQFQKLTKHSDLLMGVGLLAIIGMLIMPLPEFVLDTGLVVAMATSVVILLTSVNVKEPLQFSVFPSLLLVTTLLRLSLSVAATKLILGTGSAGHVIKTFGEFVLGGNFVVGFVSFLILMIVQFVVITNGATRVSEVVARFTLDAMPGKQMAIDADLAAGLIDEDGARERRKSVKAEADFYGAMDGASKFVKGDAVASILIITVNIIGGFAVGFMRGEGDPLTILSTYAMLSVGEGLVSQIPALLISTASGMLVTRNGQESGMAGTMFSQVLAQPRVLMTTGGALGVLAFVPGFPTLIFLAVGAVMVGLSQLGSENPLLVAAMGHEPKKDSPKAQVPIPPTGPEAVMGLISVDALEIEIGYGITRLADSRNGGDLPDRVTATRRQIALELGYVMPSVRIRDNAILHPNEYIIKVRGEEVARAEALPEYLLAIDSGTVLDPVPGMTATEPVFKLKALWIEPHLRESAERSGYTVVEPAAMIATHLCEVVKTHASELLSRQDVQSLLENCKQSHEAVVAELGASAIPLGDSQKVLQHLLRERVPIRDMVTILETVCDFHARVKDMEQLGELVRAAIARTLTRQFCDEQNRVFCLTLEPSLERELQESVQHTAGGVILAAEPGVTRQLVSDLQEAIEHAQTQGQNAVLLCSSPVRLPLRKQLERSGLNIPVLAYNEISAQAQVEFVGTIAGGDATLALAA